MAPLVCGGIGRKLLVLKEGELQSSFTPSKRVSLGSAIGGVAGFS